MEGRRTCSRPKPYTSLRRLSSCIWASDNFKIMCYLTCVSSVMIVGIRSHITDSSTCFAPVRFRSAQFYKLAISFVRLMMSMSVSVWELEICNIKLRRI